VPVSAPFNFLDLVAKMSSPEPGSDMQRREFITFLGGTAAAWPLAARAQQPAKPVVGVVGGQSFDADRSNVVAFHRGLNETGYVDGQNVPVEYHWLDGQYDRAPALMADLVRRRVAVIATTGSVVAALAAKAATATIPVVFGVPEDPVRLGLVASLVKRREFIGLVGGAALSRSLDARAQLVKVPTVGILGAGAESSWAPNISAFRQRLSELGWIDGRTVTIVTRWAEGKSDRFAEIAAEFVQRNVDVILTAGSAIPAVKQATSTIPVVFAVAVDPLASGFVASLARPGGNVTGLSLQSSEMVFKRVALLREAIPGLTRLAVLANAGYIGAVHESAAAEAAARHFGLDVDALDIRSTSELAPAIESLRGKTRAVYICQDSFVVANLIRINGLARDAGVATMWGARAFCEADGFISYGADEVDLFRRAGDYVDKILKGTKPADIPVEQPTKIELVFNLKTAKILNLNIPPNVLALANDVFE
jgi:putative tryptophan/tyrosine transport system substrate-binding protein